MDYIEVNFEISPFEEDFADIIISEINDLGFESYSCEEPYLKAYITKELFIEAHLKSILSGFKGYGFGVKYTLNLIPEQNWNATWESDYESVTITTDLASCTIKASHQKAPSTNKLSENYIIDIDPDMSFGTGHHNTTAMMVEALLEKDLTGLSVLDMGCGTGVLAILAALKGASSPVHAIDIEQRAVAASWNNAKLNKTQNKLEILCGDASYIQSRKYDLILANINRNILIQDMDYYARGLKANGKLFISGFFDADTEQLISAAKLTNLNLLFKKNKIEQDTDSSRIWAMLAFTK